MGLVARGYEDLSPLPLEEWEAGEVVGISPPELTRGRR